ncbi:MlaD family protein [Nocardia sp. NPDC050710]|uniref:MlaD family protein n=1 Tax=Nocardia sp. NPDC050710 TaxID=3157220 RepID=UPI0033EECFBA
MKFSSIASLGAIGAIFVIGSSYLSFGVVRVDWFVEQTSATMVVRDSAGLLPRSKVLLSGLEIGQVTSVRHVGETIEIGFRYDADYHVPVTSTVRIEALSGLGEPYLDFRPTAPGGPYLIDGARLDADRVVAPVSIPEVARTATQLLQQVDPAAVGSIIDTFTTGLAGTEAVVPQLSRATDLLAATLLSRTALIRDMLVAMQANATEMAWGGDQLTEAAPAWTDFGPRVAQVADAIARVIRIGDTPADYLTDTEEMIGLVPLVNELAAEIEKLGPDLRTLLPVFTPLFDLTTGIIGQIDLGSLISQALHATDPDGALQLRITVK